MYLVNKYVLGTKNGDGYMLYDIDTSNTKWVTPDELKELARKHEVYNSDVELNITGQKRKVTTVVDNEPVVVYVITLSDNIINKARRFAKDSKTYVNEVKDTPKSGEVTIMEKFKQLCGYCEHVRELLCNGTPVAIDVINMVLNPSTKEQQLINNGDYDLSCEDKLIPVDIYMAFYSLENDKTPVWTNLICYSEKNRNFIKISQILAFADLADGDDSLDNLHCDNGRSYVNDCTTSINEMVYYGIDWVNRNNEIYARARKNYGDEVVDTTLAKIPYENVRNFTHMVYGG